MILAANERVLQSFIAGSHISPTARSNLMKTNIITMKHSLIYHLEVAGIAFSGLNVSLGLFGFQGGALPLQRRFANTLGNALRIDSLNHVYQTW